MSQNNSGWSAWAPEHQDIIKFLGQFRSDEPGFLSAMEYELEGQCPLTEEQVAEVRKYMDPKP